MNDSQYPSLSLESASASNSEKKAQSLKAFELKGFMFSILTMCLKQIDIQLIEKQFSLELSKLPDFSGEPIVIDLHDVSSLEEAPDFSELVNLIYKYKLTPVGICNGNEIQRTAATSLNIPILEGGATSTAKRRSEENIKKESKVKELGAAKVKDPVVESAPATYIIDAPVRTGQRIFSKGDVTVLAGVNPGAEVLAVGSIHVYGPLRGRALAGVGGDTNARIFTKCMEAELVSIAGSFRVLESDLSPDIQGKPAQIYLENERVVIKPL